ncbi:hypothetical protein [Psychrobacter lutiphocae]|uniref:hypothetical protein n=1 Tax=Psychrobacter lutiphocae TaxID=540500 RepID=UPI00036A282B|nr:hypothetical protein [Psychrobacter lutiphocae]
MSYYRVCQAAIAVGSMMLCLTAFGKEPVIEARKAALYVGRSALVCGNLVEIKHLPNRHYLNLDKKYPNQNLTVLLWNKDYQLFEQRFGKIENHLGSRLCAHGKINEYKDKLQINIANLQLLRLID